MPNRKNKQNTIGKFQSLSPLKQLLAMTVIFLTVLFISSVAVYAYQTYVAHSNDETNQDAPQNPDENCEYGRLSDGECRKHMVALKPIIYLYPTKIEDVKVKLDYNGKLTSTYPTIDTANNGWNVTAKPDGSLVNRADNKAYSYLFWEGVPNTDFSKFDTGFIVKGSDTKDFLQTNLAKLGLTPKEYNEMIVFWLPKMEHNKYNLVHFAGSDYTDNAKLTITPKPDSVLRVFMVFKPLSKYQSIKAQQLPAFERKGFAVIEWGGTEIK